MLQPDCLFCKIIDEKIPAAVVHRDADLLAFKDIKPCAPFHVLVIPTHHIASLADGERGHDALFGKLMLTGAALAKEAGFGETGFRVVMNSGPDAGQSVHHVHLHVLGGRRLAWPPG